jgi:capsular polysaccharide transport system permease protein
LSDATPTLGGRLVVERGAVADRLAAAAAARRFVNRRRRFEAGFSDRRRAATERLFTVLSFVLIVALPNMAATTYFGWLAADQYVSEARFVLRPNIARIAASEGEATVGVGDVVRDTQVVADFLESRAILEALEASVGVRARYAAEPFGLAHLLAPPVPDAIAGLDADEPVETAVRYWERMAEARIVPSSGVVIFTVRAFSPGDARLLADRSLEEAEALVNAMNARIWGDAVGRAEALFAEAADRLGAAEARLSRVRDEAGIVEPGTATAALVGLISDARATVAALERDLAARRAHLGPGAAPIRALERQIAAANDQVRALEAQMVAQGGAGATPTVAEALERFAEAGIEREFAARSFLAAGAQLERARHAAEAQSLYLDVFAPPALAEDATHPRRGWWLVGIVATSLALWATLRGLFLLARNHMA